MSCPTGGKSENEWGFRRSGFSPLIVFFFFFFSQLNSLSLVVFVFYCQCVVECAGTTSYVIQLNSRPLKSLQTFLYTLSFEYIYF